MLQLTQNKQIKIEDLYFLAESTKEPYNDAHLITAKSAYVGIIEGALIDRVLRGEINTSPLDDDWNSLIKSAVRQNAFDKTFYIHEYVDVQPTHITVCLNKDVVDEAFVDEAVARVSTALQFLDGTYGKVLNSKKLFFSVKDIPWLNGH